MKCIFERSFPQTPLIYLALLLICSSCLSPIDELKRDMIDIPSGSFLMGSTDFVADPDEYPEHKVNVSSFRLCRVEVRQRLWNAVMGENPSFHKGKNLPVEMVSYYDIERFLLLLNNKTGKKYRLPTEIEWEYAANRGMKENDYSLEDMAWFEHNSGGKSHPVGKKESDALGLYDMIGNVNEWVSGVYDGKNYLGETVTPFDSLEIEALFRGGAFNSPPKYCRKSNRNHVRADMRNFAIGLRLAE